MARAGQQQQQQYSYPPNGQHPHYRSNEYDEGNASGQQYGQGSSSGYGYAAALRLPAGAAARPMYPTSSNNERGRSSESYISDDTTHSHTGLLAFRQQQPGDGRRNEALTPEYGDEHEYQRDQYASYRDNTAAAGQQQPPLESPELLVYKEQFMPSTLAEVQRNNPPNTVTTARDKAVTSNNSANGHTLEKSTGTLSHGKSVMGGGGYASAGENVSSFLKGYATPHQLIFLVIVLCQTLATAVMIALTWGKIQAGTPETFSQLSTSDERSLRRRSITVYLAIFLFGSVFEIITALDALRLNNTIQLIGVVLFVVAMMASRSSAIPLHTPCLKTSSCTGIWRITRRAGPERTHVTRWLHDRSLHQSPAFYPCDSDHSSSSCYPTSLVHIQAL